MENNIKQNSIMLKDEKLGLTMIVASVLVIVLIVGLLLNDQHKSREEQYRSQGLSLIRVLSAIPYDQLSSMNGVHGPLQVVRLSQNNPDFAYVALVDVSGRVINEASANSIIIPKGLIKDEPSSWIGERVLSDENNRMNFLELHAPVLEKGVLKGYLRLAFIKPELGLSQNQLTFFASLSLPVFLLTPLFYFLIKKEISPLKNVNNALSQLIDANQFQKIEVTASGEMAEFMRYFNDFVGSTRDKIKTLENKHIELEVTSKLISYQRKRIESVFESMPEGIAVLDDTGMISFANKKLAPILGVECDEVIGTSFRDWCKNPEVLEFLMAFDNVSSSHYSGDSVEFTPEFTPEKTIMVIAYPLISPKDDNHIQGTLIVFRDVTIENLAKRNRGEFIAHVAHELKTPLNVLSMYSEALIGEDGKSEDFRIEAVNTIYDEVDRLSTLINNLLNITRFEMGNICVSRQRVKLHDLLEDALENVSRIGKEADITFTLDMPHEFSPVSVDKDLLRIAINNLLTNAIKYNRKGGLVEVHAEESESQIIVKVRDTGIGISEMDISRIFDKFYRSEDDEVRQRTGHGLGLPLAKEIIELHHGSLTVSSVQGEGSVFTILFEKDSGLIQKAI